MGWMLPLMIGSLALSAGGLGYGIYGQKKAEGEQEAYLEQEQARQAMEKKKTEKALRQAALSRAVGGSLQTKPRIESMAAPPPVNLQSDASLGQAISSAGSSYLSDPERYNALLRKLQGLFQSTGPGGYSGYTGPSTFDSSYMA